MSNDTPHDAPDNEPDNEPDTGDSNPFKGPPLQKPDPEFSEPTSPFENSPFQKDAKVASAPEGATFSMLHIIFWTAGIGLAMSVDPGAFAAPGQMDNQSAEMMMTYAKYARVVTGLGMGPLIGMLPFWWIYRSKGVSFPYHPGHWLILYYGFTFLLSVIANWVQRATGTLPVFNETGFDEIFQQMGPQYIVNATAMLAGGIVAWMAFADLKRDRPIWRMTFGILAIQSTLGAIGSVVAVIGIYFSQPVMWVGVMTTGLVSGCVAWVFFILVIIAVIMDFAEKNRRDWLHWLPFILLALTISLSMVTMIVAMVAMM